VRTGALPPEKWQPVQLAVKIGWTSLANDVWTWKVTATVRGVLIATGEATLTVAVKVPIGRPPVTGASVRVAGAVVEESERLSHPLAPGP
jgi:hypothetical protein